MKKIYLLIVLLLTCLAPAWSADGIRLSHGPYLQNMSSNEVTIVWCSDKPSIGWVELAPDGDDSFYSMERPRFYDTKIGIKTTSNVHCVKLTGLKPGTRYRYRVFAKEVLSHEGHHVIYGNAAATEVYDEKPLSFRTVNPEAKSISFAMVNDIHGDNNMLKKLVSECDLKKTDFFLFNGDMVSSLDSEKQVFDGFMDTAVKLFASTIPMYYTRGNHETRGMFATEFPTYFSPKMPHLYYMFSRGPVCFVILDTGEDKPDSDIEYAGITDYDNYRSEQANWLREVLTSKEYTEAPFKVIVAHMPPAEDWHGQRDVLAKFVPLLNEAKPDIMLCGHLHEFKHWEATSAIHFPILVNSNNSVLQAEAGRSAMDLKVLDENGKELDHFTLKK